MSERMKKQFEGKKLKQETSPKLTGSVCLLLAVLIFAIGFLVHYIQIGSLPNDAVVDLLVAQLNMKFATDFLVGFLTGIGAVVGIYYLMQNPRRQCRMHRPEGTSDRLKSFMERHNIPALLNAPRPLRVAAVILLMPLLLLGCLMACS